MENECIIFVPYLKNFGGGERVLLALSKYLYENKIPHRFVCYSQSFDWASFSDWPIKVTELLKSGPQGPLAKIIVLKKYLESHYVSKMPLLIGMQAVMHAGMGFSKNYYSMIFDTPSLLSKKDAKLKGFINKTFTRFGMKRAKVVITTTNYQASEIMQLYGVSAIISRQGGKSIKHLDRSVVKNNQFNMLSVCRLEENKRIDWILNALAQLESKSPSLSKKVDWKFNIVGDGSCCAKLKAMTQQLRLSSRVFFYGETSDVELEETYARSNLFLMPARQGYGLPALEALTRRIPAVIHRESGVSEILTQTPWVDIIDNGVDDLVIGIEKMVDRVLSENLSEHLLPKFPSESEWAREICQICQWI